MKEFASSLLNEPFDVSKDFFAQENNYFIASQMLEFDDETAAGRVEFKRYARKVRMCFNQLSMPFEESPAWEFPPEYGQNLNVPFSISFITPRTIRIRMMSKSTPFSDEPSLMLYQNPGTDKSWNFITDITSSTYTNTAGSIRVLHNPFNMEIRDTEGRLLTKTLNISDTKNLENSDPIPFSIVRRAADLRRRIAASFSSSPGEKIYGCGESFAKLDKHGQKIVMFTSDAFGVQTREMYKPVPFFMSSRGYGMFVHTSAPLTFDFGNMYDQANTVYLGDEQLDLFIFLGSPKEILSEYTALTGRSPLPPLWSFGLWMSRITYFSQNETMETAQKLRDRHIPCDVIHLDTGWFETDWRCNYKFSETRFEDPEKMIGDLRKMGFHISLWQLPYFAPTNELYTQAVEKGYVIFDADGGLPTEDAILDFSNPEAVLWYQDLLKHLFEMGVGAIKADFGEAAPLQGRYFSGKSGFYEHNLYPLRYNKAVSEVTANVTGNSVIWARSAWAGSQRYPLHWGGDAENTDSGMAATLRGGLSLGLCGFSFWSHDIGGFVQKSPEELYRRWLPFGILSSHSRCHGAPPKEPWEYSERFEEDFRKTVELKYRLMPYIFAQAKICSELGYPMHRTLFFEFPDDKTAWYIEDEYMLGENLLVAPLFEENTAKRDVYLPDGLWIDYQTYSVYEGGRWYNIYAGDVPVVLLVKDGSIIPRVKLAQCTGEIDWNEIELLTFDENTSKTKGVICLPGDNKLIELSIERIEGKAVVTGKNLPQDVKWTIHFV